MTYLRGDLALAKNLGHQPIFDIAVARTLLKVALGQEHIPQTELLRLGLQFLHDGGGGLPSLLAFAQLSGEDSLGGDTLFLDKLLDLCRCSNACQSYAMLAEE